MVPILLFFSGVVLMGFGIYRYKGPVSVWYLAYGTYTVGHNYLAIPGGISVMLFALVIPSFLPMVWKMPIVILAIVVTILGLVFAKHLFTPTWLRWLEQEHGSILPMLRIEIQEMGLEKWNHRINTQEELEEWINDVKLQRKLKTVGAADWEHPITTQEEWDEWVNNTKHKAKEANQWE